MSANECREPKIYMVLTHSACMGDAKHGCRRVQEAGSCAVRTKADRCRAGRGGLKKNVFVWHVAAPLGGGDLVIGLDPLWPNACACAREGRAAAGDGSRSRQQNWWWWWWQAEQVAAESGSPGPEYEPPERRRSQSPVCDGGHDSRERRRVGEEQQKRGLLPLVMLCACVCSGLNGEDWVPSWESISLVRLWFEEDGEPGSGRDGER